MQTKLFIGGRFVDAASGGTIPVRNPFDNSGVRDIAARQTAHPASPFGGTGESGNGRDMGFKAMREYTQPKSIRVNVDAAIAPHYER